MAQNGVSYYHIYTHTALPTRIVHTVQYTETHNTYWIVQAHMNMIIYTMLHDVAIKA